MIFLFFFSLKICTFFRKSFIGVRIRRSGVCSSSLKDVKSFDPYSSRIQKNCLAAAATMPKRIIVFFTFLFVCFWHNRKKEIENFGVKLSVARGSFFCYSIGFYVMKDSWA